MGNRDELIGLLKIVKDMPPGAELERWLNETYGPSTPPYQDLAAWLDRP
ncbi:hypothetical protein FHX08_005569 [Rhizobium sp. BK529]|nr:DUF4863 family protein [Rhizobium sp. BK529]MBB3595159.1 hypothetical protein [Rhizobium sp. BK529]